MKMKTNFILPLNDKNAAIESVGGKGNSLARMVNAGLPVPGGFFITTEAYKRFVSDNNLKARILEALEITDRSKPDTLEMASQVITGMFTSSLIPDEIAKEIVLAYAELPGSNPAVAVRSSATAEDLPEASFAGQQETYLNVHGDDAVLEATRKCWASLWTARAIGYRIRHGIHPENIALAVVIQLLVPAEAAGILFTANPVNGRRDQAVINASWGLGDAVVGGRVTPDTLTCDKNSGVLVERDTAEKRTQTVRTGTGTVDMPVPEHLQLAPVLSDHQAKKLVQLGSEIENLYGMPMDIEWTLFNGQFAIVQARPITALPAPEAEVPTDWDLPEGAYIAMQNNIVELMADPLTPLFKTMGLSAVNTSMGNLLTAFFGKPGFMPGELIITVNEYAYYNGSISFGNMIRLFLRAGSILKYMFTGAVERWTETGRPKYIDTVDKWRTRKWVELNASQLIHVARELTEAAIDAYGALVSGVIPAAWISEALFTFINKLVKRRDDPDAPTYLMGFENVPIQSEKALYDLVEWIQTQPALKTYLLDTPTFDLIEHIQGGEKPPNIERDEWVNWRTRFQVHLGEYGHMIYNLDFGRPVPADDPAPLVDTIKLFLAGQGTNPYERQGELTKRRETATHQMLSRLKGVRLRIFQRNLERAQKYAPLREDGLADVGLSYPLVRKMLLEVGRRLVTGGMIKDPADIFWLPQDEVEDAAYRMDQGKALDDRSEMVLWNKAIWRAAIRATPPMALPQIKIFGRDLMALKSGGIKRKRDDTLKGVGASPGSVTAAASVIHGPEDFSKMRVGEILVAPLTTPAWTPLFTRAAGIVTDVGGPLSHGSIVAREYGIPAVLGTGGATRRIQSGQVITVDGSSGIVTLSQPG
jgi:phosphoenolpyruvate synthase/pyruvate phosphate dikinase